MDKDSQGNIAEEQELQRTRERLRAKDEQIRHRDREIKSLRAQLKDGGKAASSSLGNDGSEAPAFFVVGRGKSGTSWLMRIFDAHPDILCRGEGRFFGRDWKREDLKSEQVGVPPRSLYGAIRESEYLRYWIERSVWSRGGDLEEHLAGVTRAAADYFLEQKLAESGKRIVGDKTPLLTPEFVRDIAEVYPDAKVVHIVRDGRDVTVSAVHHQWNKATDQGGSLRMTPDATRRREAYRQDPSSTSMFSEDNLRGRARAWRNFVGRASEDGPALLGDNYTEVRYEDLLERPEEETKRLLSLLGAKSDEKTVKQCVEKTSFEKLSRGRKPGEEDATSFFRKGIAGDWKNVFTERDREIFEEEAGDLLTRLGYER
ncbi:sulfotransferase [Rubrobacter aplysinae]|uniref:sulfotransferase n=1 Tax=Rubrobacter aplysinae TaxID=909625 RepID=UPI00064BDD46|nr:sulfotransferase [Rubrobacter aplysinae]